MFTIRSYKNSDYATIKSWWDEHKEMAPLEGMMIENGTFVLEFSGEPIMTITALITQSRDISLLEGFCSKPGLPKVIRTKASTDLVNHSFAWLKQQGYQKVMCFTDNEKLISRYKQLGMSTLGANLSVLGRRF